MNTDGDTNVQSINVLRCTHAANTICMRLGLDSTYATEYPVISALKIYTQHTQCTRRSGHAATVQGAWSGFLNLFYGWSWISVNLCLFACASCWVLTKPLLLPFPHRSVPCQLSILRAGKRWNVISIVTFKATKLHPCRRRKWIEMFFLKNVFDVFGFVTLRLWRKDWWEKITPTNETTNRIDFTNSKSTFSKAAKNKKRPRGQDANAAKEAAFALGELLLQGSALTGLPPEPTAHAVLGAMRRHPGHERVQDRGCGALYLLCKQFAELHGALRRDPSVYATVRAAAKVAPNLEKHDEYSKELCVWLQPCLVWRGRCRWGVGQEGRLVVPTKKSQRFFCNTPRSSYRIMSHLNSTTAILLTDCF